MSKKAVSTVSAFLPAVIITALLLGGCATGAGSKTDQTRQSLDTGSLTKAGQQADAALTAAQSQGDQQNLANALDNAGLVLLQQGDLDLAEGRFREALLQRQSAPDSTKAALARSHLNLGLVALRRGSTDSAAAELHLGLDLVSTTNGLESALAAAALYNASAELATMDAKFADAAAALGAADGALLLAKNETDAVALRFAVQGNRARLARSRGDFRSAIQQLESLLASQRAQLPPGNTSIAVTLNNLAETLGELGDGASARQYYLDALGILDQAEGSRGDIAIVTGNLAHLSNALGRPAEASELATRALALQEKALGRQHPALGPTLSILADIAYRRGNLVDAEQYNERALTIYEKAFGPDHPQMLSALMNAGELARQEKRNAAATEIYRRAQSVIDRAYGRDSLPQVTLLAHQAELALSSGQAAEAVARYRDGLAIGVRILGNGHPRLARLQLGLAEAQRRKGDYATALETYRALAAQLSGRQNPISAAENRQILNAYLRYLSFLAEGPSGNANAEESFKAAQLLGITRTAKAIAQMSARLAAGSDALATVLRNRQDAGAGLRQVEDNLVAAAAKPGDSRDPDRIAALQAARSSYLAVILRSEVQLAASFPAFNQFESPKPASLQEVSELLPPNSAMLAFAATPNGIWGWAVGPGGTAFRSIVTDLPGLEEAIIDMRRGLDPFAAPDTDANGLPVQFPAALAHRLYAELVAPFRSVLGTADKLYVVPSGPLHSLPFEVLLTAAPATAAIADAASYRRADWLVRDYAISYLPAVSSLRLLSASRHVIGRGAGFLGIGDPLLANHPGAGTVMLDSTASQIAARGGAGASEVFRGANANPTLIAALPSLPETAEELTEMRRVAGSGDLMLRQDASETAVKARGDLANFGIVAFATHGLVAGDMNGLVEPGLVLTPPERVSDQDDGYLSSSDVAGLRLNANWVILSACNTAAPDGSPDAESLSGLARAFFYAGARSLMVSHWAVASEPTVKLTTKAIAAAILAKSGRAKAHQESMLAMIDGADDLYTHPAIWAPFVVVGSGE